MGAQLPMTRDVQWTKQKWVWSDQQKQMNRNTACSSRASSKLSAVYIRYIHNPAIIIQYKRHSHEMPSANNLQVHSWELTWVDTKCRSTPLWAMERGHVLCEADMVVFPHEGILTYFNMLIHFQCSGVNTLSRKACDVSAQPRVRRPKCCRIKWNPFPNSLLMSGALDLGLPRIHVIADPSLGLLGSVGICWDLLGSVGICWDLLGSVGICWDLLGSVGICWDLLGSVGICWDLLGSVGICWDLLGSVGICWDLLGSVGICWDLLGMIHKLLRDLRPKCSGCGLKPSRPRVLKALKENVLWWWTVRATKTSCGLRACWLHCPTRTLCISFVAYTYHVISSCNFLS